MQTDLEVNRRASGTLIHDCPCQPEPLVPLGTTTRIEGEEPDKYDTLNGLK
jgi:hypothetical protein